MENMGNRVSGPMKFRLVLQPVMASIFAIISGLNDAKAGKPPYFWALFTDPAHRTDMIRDGWKSVGKVFVLALVLDVVYQINSVALRISWGGAHRRVRSGDRAIPDPARTGQSSYAQEMTGPAYYPCHRSFSSYFHPSGQWTEPWRHRNNMLEEAHPGFFYTDLRVWFRIHGVVGLTAEVSHLQPR